MRSFESPAARRNGGRFAPGDLYHAPKATVTGESGGPARHTGVEIGNNIRCVPSITLYSRCESRIGPAGAPHHVNKLVG